MVLTSYSRPPATLILSISPKVTVLSKVFPTGVTKTFKVFPVKFTSRVPPYIGGIGVKNPKMV